MRKIFCLLFISSMFVSSMSLCFAEGDNNAKAETQYDTKNNESVFSNSILGFAQTLESVRNAEEYKLIGMSEEITDNSLLNADCFSKMERMSSFENSPSQEVKRCLSTDEVDGSASPILRPITQLPDDVFMKLHKEDKAIEFFSLLLTPREDSNSN